MRYFRKPKIEQPEKEKKEGDPKSLAVFKKMILNADVFRNEMEMLEAFRKIREENPGVNG